QAEDGIRDFHVTGVQTCALPIFSALAAELVQKALENEPHRRDLRLKLLEVFFVWGNKEAFREAAQAFKAEIGATPDGDWDKVLRSEERRVGKEGRSRRWA